MYRVTDLSTGFFKPVVCTRIAPSLFYEQPSRSVTLTRCHLNLSACRMPVYTMPYIPCPYFATLPFFFPLLQNRAKFMLDGARSRGVYGKVVWKITERGRERYE